MFGIGVQEMAFLAIIALLVFGPKRLPELARTLAASLFDSEEGREGMEAFTEKRKPAWLN